MTETPLIRGTTHRFWAYFKDKVTGALVTMTDATVKVKFYANGILQGTELLANYSAQGTYYYDRYFNETDPLGIWKVTFTGEAAGSQEKKKAVERFDLVDSYP